VIGDSGVTNTKMLVLEGYLVCSQQISLESHSFSFLYTKSVHHQGGPELYIFCVIIFSCYSWSPFVLHTVLDVNAAKCELMAHSGLVVDDPLLQSFSSVEPGDTTLLGAPLFPGGVLNDFWSDCCRDLSRAVDRLCLVGRRANSSTSIVLCSQSPAFAALFALDGRARTRRF